MAASLSLLYTANLAGNLALLPRLHTYAQRLKAGASGPSLLLDLGASCCAESWHCRATGNRSVLIALDGMGYEAANCEGLLEAGSRAKLAQQVSLALVDRWHRHTLKLPSLDRPIALTLQPLRRGNLEVLLEPAASTQLEAGALRLQSVSSCQLGEASVDLRGEPRLLSARIHDMPADTPPNPSIAGLVEFVENEARYYASKRDLPLA